jgi:hypothetical protein
MSLQAHLLYPSKSVAIYDVRLPTHTCRVISTKAIFTHLTGTELCRV